MKNKIVENLSKYLTYIYVTEFINVEMKLLCVMISK